MAGNLTAMIAAAFSGSAAPPVTSDPYYEYTTLLLPGNGTNGAQNNTFLDSSTNNFTISRNGHTTQGTFSPFSQTGWGNYFNGSSNLETPDAAALHLGTGDFTVEGWAYATTTSVSRPIYFHNYGGYELGIFINSGNNLVAASYGASTNFVITSSSTVSANFWFHFALVRSGSGSNNVVLYIDGVSRGTATYTGTMTNGFAGGYRIARDYSSTYLTGYISNLRVVKGTAVYTSNFTPSTTPLTAISGTSLLTCQSNRFVDNSSNNFTITTSGSPSVQAFSPFNPSASWSAATYGGSGYFDGSGDYLTATTSSLNTTTFTLEFWGYFTVLNSGSPYYVFNLSGGGSGQLLIGKNDPGFPGRCLFVDNSGSTVFNLQGGTINANEWTHFACVKDGANASLWINGTRVATTSSAATSPTFSGTSAFWGGLNSSVAVITGYLSSFRLVSGSAVYSTSSTSITVPTAPLTAITNTSLLLNYTNAGIYDATSKNDLETVGNAQISTAQSKWGGSSMAFDGTTDYLLTNVASSDLYSFGSGDWTVEFWVRFNNTTGDGCIFDTRNATDTLNVTILRSTTTILFQTGGSTRITSGTITSNVWYHVAVARSGTSTKMFIDGTQAGSTYTDTTSYTAGANRPIIGAVSLSGFVGISSLNGYIQDLRVTKGYARYTTNFTAPTAAFPTL
jgi:hypothetical protein